MRLPSVSYDKNELVHGISDGPESLMEAEEYLQPVDEEGRRPPRGPERQMSNMSTVGTLIGCVENVHIVFGIFISLF